MPIQYAKIGTMPIGKRSGTIGDSLDPKDERDALIAFYSVERQEEQSMNPVYVALLAAALALIAALGIAFVAGGVKGWMYSLMPILPVPVFAATALYMMAAGLRHEFIRAIERRLDDLLDITLDGRFQVPSHLRLGNRVFGNASRAYGFVGLVGAIGVAAGLMATYLALTIASAIRATDRGYGLLGVAVSSVCGVSALILTAAAIDSWRDSGWLVRRELAREGLARDKGEGQQSST